MVWPIDSEIDNEGRSQDMSAKRASVAGRIGKLGLDDAFTEAEARSLAGQASEIWCRRDFSGRPVAYRVVAYRPGRNTAEGWERIALFHAIDRPGDSTVRSQRTLPRSA